MAQFDFMQLFNPRKIWENMPWLVVGGIAGDIIWNWLSTSPVLYVAPSPSMNIGAYGPQPEQTNTYGYGGTEDTPKF